MPQLPSVSELLVGGHIPPVAIRSSGLLPESRTPPLGSSPRQSESYLSMYYRPSSKSQPGGSSPPLLKQAPDVKQREAAFSSGSRRPSSEYAPPGYERSYVMHPGPQNDYFSYRDPHPGRLHPELRQPSGEQLNRMPLYNSVNLLESVLRITPPAVASPDFRSRPRPASFSHAPIPSILYSGPKQMPLAVNTGFPRPPTSCTTLPHGAPIYGPSYPYPMHNPQHPHPTHPPSSQPSVTMNHAMNSSHVAPHSMNLTHAPMNSMFAPEPSAREQNNALINKRRVTKRRTRSGCMTCRKRRIKCDERKPHCYNCERSKKLCLGYELVTSNTRRSQEDLKPKARSLVHSLM